VTGPASVSDLSPRPVPLLTPSLPGTGGLVRALLEDFRVEELPLYPASGQGEHLYLEVEKRGRTTPDVARELAAALGASERDVGYAGLKDKRAIAVQRFSVPTRASPAELSGPGWRALGFARHANKLRPGHLGGNRFAIAVRGCVPDALECARAVCAEVRLRGAANLYGPQRFGMRGDNAALGASVLARKAPRLDRFRRRLALSALQAELFNRCLAARIAGGLFASALDGDVMKKRASGGLFVCDDPSADAARVAAGEIDPCGPLPGHDLYPARGAALAREQAVLAEAGIDPASFAAGGDEMRGARRPYRIPVDDLDVSEPEPGRLLLCFSLPKGSYAAAVLREILKEPAVEELAAEEE